MDAFSANSVLSSDDSLYKQSSEEQNIIRHAGPGVMSKQEEWNEWMRENIASAAGNASRKKKSLEVEESGNTMDSYESTSYSIEKNGPEGQQTEKDPGTETWTVKENGDSKEKGIVRMVCILTCLIVLELIMLFFLISRKKGILFTSVTDFQPKEEVCQLYNQAGTLSNQSHL